MRTTSEGLRLNLAAGVKLVQYRTAAGRRRLAHSYRAKIERALKPIVGADADAVRRKVAEGVSITAFTTWVEQYFGDRESPTREAVEGAYSSLATDTAGMAAREIKQDPSGDRVTGLAGGYARQFGQAWRRNSITQLQRVANDAGLEDYAAAVSERVTEWEKGGQGATRAHKSARREAISLAAAVAALVFTSAGYALVWVTFGDTCPYCDDLAGKRVRGGEQFLGPGEFNPAGANRPIKIRGGLSHPPAHGGCDCSVAAG